MRLQWGRDVSIPEIKGRTPAQSLSSSFNGAGMFLSRKCGVNCTITIVSGASMGPGCFYPGNAAAGASFLALAELQWGRDVSIPEMRLGEGDRGIAGDASMGPGCFYPGNSPSR